MRSRTLRAVLCGRWLCGHCDLAQRRRVFLAMALALRVLGGTTSVLSGTAAAFASVHLGETTSVSSDTAAAFASGHLGGMASVSSGTAAEETDMTKSS